MKVHKLLIFSFLIVVFTACVTTTPAFYSYKTECLGVAFDGSQTLKTWGKGRYFPGALEQAKKNALRDVIFKGILDGSAECKTKPILMEVNAEEKYEAYFNKFFRDEIGEYRYYITLADEKIHRMVKPKQVARNEDQSTYSIVVRVLRSELEQKLIQDNILKK
jgi:hypothetical protein